MIEIDKEDLISFTTGPWLNPAKNNNSFFPSFLPSLIPILLPSFFLSWFFFLYFFLHQTFTDEPLRDRTGIRYPDTWWMKRLFFFIYKFKFNKYSIGIYHVIVTSGHENSVLRLSQQGCRCDLHIRYQEQGSSAVREANKHSTTWQALF